jgi:flavodoxin I
MPKVIVLYTSLTGNTEEMAEAIAQGVKESGFQVTCKEAFDAKPTDLLEYDAIIIGAYTWGDGELPDEYLDFYEDMDGLDLSGKQATAFGSGDSGYPVFFGAVDLIENKLRELGAAIVSPGLKFEYTASDEEKEEGKRLGALVAGVLCKS